MISSILLLLVLRDEGLGLAGKLGKIIQGQDKHEFILKVNSRMLCPQKRDPDKPVGNVNRRLETAATKDGEAGVGGKKDECQTESVLRWASTGYNK